MISRATVVETRHGSVRGSRSEDGKISIFRGLAYAAPPVGPLRWRAPEPPASWSGVKAATAFGPRCVQPDRAANSISYFGPEPQSEDCLYLNVWTADPSPGAKRPVMVWFHGGGFSVGSGALPIFDGENLARRGVVLVTLNHRLGGLGYLAHPQLTEESDFAASGNYGLLDQIAALTWVQDNIEGFGGDANNVTIFGQSVGSSCVNVLMASPLARGLFHRAIGESGGSMAPAGLPGGGSMLYLRDAEDAGLQVARHYDCQSSAQMRALTAEEIQLRWPKPHALRPFMVIDGHAVPRPLNEAYAEGRQFDVPLLTGANSDESSAIGPAATLEDFQATLKYEFGDQWQRLYAAYGGGEDFAYISRRLGCHKRFNWVNWTWAREHQRTSSSKVYFYHFSQAPPLPDEPVAEGRGSKLGAFHTAEIPYVFGTQDRRPLAWTREDRDLSATMMGYWVNFATSGDPNGHGLPVWPVLNPDGATIMHFDHEPRIGNLPEREIFDLWDDCMSKLRV